LFRQAAQRSAWIHPIPLAFTDPHGLGERLIARRSTVDL
jgi:hypothetical protein